VWDLWRSWDPAPGLLPLLRTLFTYTDRTPGRATGWLYLPDREPRTAWPAPLAETGPGLLARLEDTTGCVFTACCFQAYLDGTGCGWHHDQTWGAQAILSLGVTRTFGLRGPTGDTYLHLGHGDLLFMPAGFQDEWEHCVPAEPIRGERCSLVFRTATP